MIAQFTAKITNSEKAIYFLSLCHLRLSLMLSTFCHLCSINTLKSHMFFTRKSFMFSDFTWKKNILLQEMVRGTEGGWRPLPPFSYGPEYVSTDSIRTFTGIQELMAEFFLFKDFMTFFTSSNDTSFK